MDPNRLDRIDRKILSIVKRQRCVKIADIARELRDVRSESAIRARIYRLWFLGFLRLNHSIAHGKVFCELSEKGERCVEGVEGWRAEI